MLEFYWAYADVNEMMDFCENMLRAVVFTVLGHTHVKFGDHELILARCFDVLNEASLSGLVEPDQITNERVLELFETHVEHGLVQPTFITDFPKLISPLSKASPANPHVAERFELYIAGMEIANGFSELNDPVEQYDRFRDQVRQRERGDEEGDVDGRRLHSRTVIRHATGRRYRHRIDGLLTSNQQTLYPRCDPLPAPAPQKLIQKKAQKTHND